MKLSRVLAGAASVFALTAGVTTGDELPPCENCADTMVAVSWGGAYQRSQQMAYTIPYAEMTGVDVVWDESSAEAVALLRAQSEAGNITWDVVDVTGADSIRLCDDGLAMPVDHDELLAEAPDGTPPTEDFGETIVSECFIPQIVFSTTFGYRHDLLDEQPDSVCDVFDLERFPGRRALEARPIGNMEWALICDGVDIDEVYDVLETDEGVERALAKLGTIKSEVIWWQAGAETPQLLADGEVVMGSTYNGRLFAAIEEEDQPISMLWEWQMFDLDGWIIPEDLPEDRLNRVKHFLHFATDTQRLADQAAWISYGPARESSQPLVGEHAELGIEMAEHMPTHPDNAERTFLFNYEWWADYRDDIDARFQSWLLR